MPEETSSDEPEEKAQNEPSKESEEAIESRRREEVKEPKGSGKTVDISLNMQQVAIAAFATGLIIGVILTGATFLITDMAEDINQDGIELDVRSYDAGTGSEADNFEWAGGYVNLQERPYLGDSEADFTIVSYEDFSCVWCARHNTQRAMPQLLDNEIADGDVQYFYTHFPRTEVGKEAAEASVCILNQGDEEFWQAKEYFFDNFQRISGGQFDEVLDEVVEGLDIDQDEFNTCYQDNRAEEFIESDQSEAQGFDYTLEDGRGFVSGTPSFVIYDHDSGEAEAFAGAQPYEEFQQIIE